MKTWVWLLLALASGAAQAEIYACAKSGVTVYQNFPCPFDSLGSVPEGDVKRTSTSTVAAPSPSLGNDAMANGKQRDALPGAGATHVSTSPRVGASEDDVRKAWGEPEEILQDEQRKGRVDVWRYKDGRSVDIDRRRRVVAVRF